MNTEILQTLLSIGLNEKEAKIYLACLQVGPGTVYQIAKLADLKRPNIYVLISGLVQKGLVSAKISGKKTIYTALPPRRLLERWRGKVELLWSVIPDLDAYYQKSAYQPKVMIFEGEQGINSVYSEMTPRGDKKEEIFIFGSLLSLQKKFPIQLKVWGRIVKNKRNLIKELINFDNGAIEYIKEMKLFNNPNYEGRVTNGNIFGFCDNIIYKSKIAIFSLGKEPFVVVIESEELAKTYKALFEMAWNNAKMV